ncbi:amidase signature enzyme [Patellaria atrata CBS 101060]|uniref:Amidase signature enzyme n=1 Tax=Patellaria atrata CBS 101060 TaxID=1346257 RepID=A0A9P4VRH6_9PEZI|nr:amidase signature enzyme [Patellaria atrata CBS 101060]
MLVSSDSWKAKTKKKTKTLAKVPSERRLSKHELDKVAKQRDLTSALFDQYLETHERDIVRQDATVIVEKVQRELTVRETTLAFCKAAAIAYRIRSTIKKNGKTMGPLHGLPISLKDQFRARGNDTTMAYIGWIGTYESCKDPELVHNVNSQTLNPNNQNLSSEGSSGGEGALQALPGSVVGFGTDIGGFLRVPAAFNGIFSLKPTHSRLSYRGVANVIPGETTYSSSVGVMGTSPDTIHLVLRSVVLTQPWIKDSNVVPILWAGTNDNKPLKLGILWTDGVVTTQPPIAVASDLWWMLLKVAFLKADGGYDIHQQLDLSGEPLVSPLRDAFQGRDYEAAYYWNSTADVDGQLVNAVIMLVAPHAAVIPGKFYHTAYTEVINLMDYRVVVIPVTKADKSIDKADPSYTPLNDVDAKNWNAYDPEIYDGAPLGVQIVARKLEEEKIWAIGKIVHEILKAAGIQ